jgi:two-component system, OmpR family, KDP operon response regulator KdpE
LDGDTGIQMVDTESPSLVILDVGLPDMDGFTVCQEIRRFSDVPIIMLTVRDRESDIVRGLQLGADDYVAKPFRPIEFMARVQSVLRRGRRLSLTATVRRSPLSTTAWWWTSPATKCTGTGTR